LLRSAQLSLEREPPDFEGLGVDLDGLEERPGLTEGLDDRLGLTVDRDGLDVDRLGLTDGLELDLLGLVVERDGLELERLGLSEGLELERLGLAVDLVGFELERLGVIVDLDGLEPDSRGATDDREGADSDWLGVERRYTGVLLSVPLSTTLRTSERLFAGDVRRSLRKESLSVGVDPWPLPDRVVSLPDLFRTLSWLFSLRLCDNLPERLSRPDELVRLPFASTVPVRELLLPDSRSMLPDELRLFRLAAPSLYCSRTFTTCGLYRFTTTTEVVRWGW